MAAPHKVLIHSYKPSPSVAKAHIAGKYGGVEVDYVEGFEMGKTNKTEEFLLKNPNGQVPVADTPDGPIFESTAIAYYVARIGNDAAGLLGGTPYQKAVVDEWVHFARSRLESVYPLFDFSFGWGAYNKEKFDEALKKVTDAFAVLERHLHHKKTPFLTGGRVTLADIVVIAHLAPPLKVSIDKTVLHQFPLTQAYLTAVLHEPNVHAVVGDVHFIEKFVPPQK